MFIQIYVIGHFIIIFIEIVILVTLITTSTNARKKFSKVLHKIISKYRIMWMIIFGTISIFFIHSFTEIIEKYRQKNHTQCIENNIYTSAISFFLGAIIYRLVMIFISEEYHT